MKAFRGLIFAKNTRHVLSQMRKFEKKITSGAYVGFLKILKIVEGEAIMLISKGALRAVDTGLLRSTILGEPTKITKDMLEGIVGASTYYAVWVHEGTSKMKERPFLRTALYRKKNMLWRIARSHIRKEMTGMWRG